jgi:hypothetical protein
MPGLSVPAYSFKLPWFMIDIDNFSLIMSIPIPGDTNITRKPKLAETPVPGLSYEPVTPGGFGNKHVSFVIPAVKKNNTVGNTLLVKQFENLHEQVSSVLDLFGDDQFVRGPKVLYSWGTGSIPLVYWVAKCDLVNRGDMYNQLSSPTWTDVDIGLIRDDEEPIYLAEEAFRKISAIAGTVINTFDVVESAITGARPF